MSKSTFDAAMAAAGFNDSSKKISKTGLKSVMSEISDGIWGGLLILTCEQNNGNWKATDDSYAPLKEAYNSIDYGQICRIKCSNAYDFVGKASFYAIATKVDNGYHMISRIATSSGYKDISYIIVKVSGFFE